MEKKIDIEIECRECGLYSTNKDLIDGCDNDESGNYICPGCGNIAIVTEHED